MLDTSTPAFSSQKANYRFAEAVLKAVKGETDIIQPSFVYLPGVPGGDAVQKSVEGLDYFSTNVELGVRYSEIGSDYSLRAPRKRILLETLPSSRRVYSRKLFLSSKGILRRESNSSLMRQSCKPVFRTFGLMNVDR